MNFLNAEVEELKKELPEVNKKLEKQPVDLERQHALTQAYVARENLVIINILEQIVEGKEDTKKVFWGFLEDRLEISEQIEIQRVHRVGAKTRGYPRLIKARLLRYTDKSLS